MDPFVIVFSGHMIDAIDRPIPRFPKEREQHSRQEIKIRLISLIGSFSDKDSREEDKFSNVIGIAGGASGGDILFHEVCQELGIKTLMLISLPKEEYIIRSVLPGGNIWEDRFKALLNDPNISLHIYSESAELPELKVSGKEAQNIWHINNLWILYTAKRLGGKNIALLALWDGKTGDGPGGTKHMIEEIEKIGAKSVVISPY